MITVQYSPKQRKLRIKGHAGYKPPGEDIVCAAASMIFYNLAQVLMEYDKEQTMTKPVEMKYGDVSVIRAYPKAAVEAWVDHDFYFALTGFRLLENQYPEHVNVVITEK